MVVRNFWRAAVVLKLCLLATGPMLRAPASAATIVDKCDAAACLLASVGCARCGTGLASVGYTRQAVGNPAALTDSTGTTTHGYDAVGNRTGLTVNGVQTTSTFDAADRLTQAGDTSYTCDHNGNDLLNRLTSIGGPTTASYQYNGDGLRVAKTVSGTTTAYTWDPTGSGTVLSDGTEYVWGDGLVSQVRSSATTFVQGDGLGSVRLLTDGSGKVAGPARALG